MTFLYALDITYRNKSSGRSYIGTKQDRKTRQQGAKTAQDYSINDIDTHSTQYTVYFAYKAISLIQ